MCDASDTVCMTLHRNRLQFECDRGRSAEAKGKCYRSGALCCSGAAALNTDNSCEVVCHVADAGHAYSQSGLH